MDRVNDRRNQPGNSIQAVVSFDVAPGTSNDGVLTVHDSIFSGGAKISFAAARAIGPDAVRTA